MEKLSTMRLVCSILVIFDYYRADLPLAFIRMAVDFCIRPSESQAPSFISLQSYVFALGLLSSDEVVDIDGLYRVDSIADDM